METLDIQVEEPHKQMLRRSTSREDIAPMKRTRTGREHFVLRGKIEKALEIYCGRPTGLASTPKISLNFKASAFNVNGFCNKTASVSKIP
jgi:hypothetical protein